MCEMTHKYTPKIQNETIIENLLKVNRFSEHIKSDLSMYSGNKTSPGNDMIISKDHNMLVNTPKIQ